MNIFDVIAAFNTIRIKEGDEWKTAFLTRFGLYEYLVMPFGLCNAPGTFQSYINKILRDVLDVFCTAYLDDIPVYSATDEEHDRHVEMVLERMKKTGLYLDIKKSKFGVRKVKYLSLIIMPEGIEMDPGKVKTIVDWEEPRSVKDIQSFLGFANFYRRIVARFSEVVRPLVEIIKRGPQAQLPLSAPALQAFKQLKKRFTTAPILAHFDPNLPTWLETDASDYVIAAVSSQEHNGVLRPVAFLSHKMSSAECNYEIYDK